MPTDLAVIVTEQSQDELSAIVRQILGDDARPVGDLTVEKIGRSAGTATAGIFHVAGQAQKRDRLTIWSAVVKVLGSPEIDASGRSEDDPYREVEVYRSGAFADLQCGVRSARCYAIQPRDGMILLWLEDLTSAPQAPWHGDHFFAAARHLGQFNACWPENALPQWDWLSHKGFRSAFTGDSRFQSVFSRLPTEQDHPLMRIYLSSATLETHLQLWRDCDTLLALAETTSVGVCHCDCHPKNLFPMNGSNGESYTVGIDWVKVGIANLGLDVGHLLSSPIQWLELSPHEAAELLRVVLDSYLEGLSDSGWSGNADTVRLTYLARVACTALRGANLTTNAMDNDKFARQVERLLGRPIDEIVSEWGRHMDFYLACRDDALRIAERL